MRVRALLLRGRHHVRGGERRHVRLLLLLGLPGGRLLLGPPLRFAPAGRVTRNQRGGTAFHRISDTVPRPTKSGNY